MTTVEHLHGSMSEAWMRMPGQTWPGAAASFLGMWVVMMVPMMLPSLLPMLWHYRQAVGSTRRTRLTWLTPFVALGYFVVWSVIGVAVYPFGVAVSALVMEQPAVARAAPIAVGVVVLTAGLLQFTAWKVRQLACCRDAAVRGGELAADAGTAWRHGLRLGLVCAPCCANLMVILLAIGVMDLRAMAAVTAAITAERLAFTNRCQAPNSEFTIRCQTPNRERVAKAIGTVVVGAGVFLIARAAGR